MCVCIKYSLTCLVVCPVRELQVGSFHKAISTDALFAAAVHLTYNIMKCASPSLSFLATQYFDDLFGLCFVLMMYDVELFSVCYYRTAQTGICACTLGRVHTPMSPPYAPLVASREGLHNARRHREMPPCTYNIYLSSRVGKD
jgi:hypothetical protein